jgi:hypothetical protein
MKQRFKQKVYDKSVATHHSHSQTHRSQHQHSTHQSHHHRAQSNDLHTRRSSVTMSHHTSVNNATHDTAYERSQLVSHLQAQRTPEHSVIHNNPSQDGNNKHLHAHSHAARTPSTRATFDSVHTQQHHDGHKHSKTHDSMLLTNSQRSRNQLAVQDIGDISSSASVVTSPRHSLNTDQMADINDSLKGGQRSVDSIT